MLVSFPKKCSFGANGQLKAFKMPLRGRKFSPIGPMWNFVGGIFLWVVGIWQGVFLTIGAVLKAKNNILCILNIFSGGWRGKGGGGKGINKFLASGWRLPFIPLVRKTLQYLPNLFQKFENISCNSLYRSFSSLNVLVWWSTIDRKK